MTYTVDRNAEGAWRVTALVEADGCAWYHTATFYGYRRAEVLPRYRANVEKAGWKVSR
jgi:hypothetical protein